MTSMSRPRLPTVHDVARRAGVSKTTVSDALSGSGRVSAATREAVRSAAEELGYQINIAARSLRTSNTGMIALHIPDQPRRSSYYIELAFGVLSAVPAHSYDVVLLAGNEGKNRDRLPHVDGVIISDPTVDDGFVRRLLDSGLPTVTAERVLSGPEANGTVFIDHSAAMRELLGGLVSSGSRHPALIVPDHKSSWVAALTRTFTEWCGSTGVPHHLARVPFIPSDEDIVGAVDDLLDHGADTIICAPADAATLASAHLQQRGRDVGRDVFVASCVDSALMQAGIPAITAIDLHPREVGLQCAETLFEIISSGNEMGKVETQIPYEVHYRDSTAGRRT